VQNTDLYRQNYRAPDTIRHSGIQPHSMGSLFPAVIAVVENYDNLGDYAVEVHGPDYPLFRRLRYRAWELNFPGEEPQLYSSREDAEDAAMMLLMDGPDTWRVWRVK
jgi:hypothetical protein